MKLAAVIGFILTVSGGALIVTAPDMLSLGFIVLMFVIALLGYLFSMIPCLRACDGFRHACKVIKRTSDTAAADRWIVLKQEGNIFSNRMLDGLYAGYIAHADEQYKNNEIISSISDRINDDVLSARCWQSLCAQIPGTMTGIGLLGTFFGLILGISGVAFSSVDSALSSIESLLEGIELAFFTSIAGVIFSVIYNLFHRLVWNLTFREENIFIQLFHSVIVPPVEEQERIKHHKEMALVLERLDRIPEDKGFRAESDIGIVHQKNEQAITEAVQEAIKNNEFSFYLMPRCNISTRKITGSEALIRWIKPDTGTVGPDKFMPVIEKNGFIARLDQYIWDSVCVFLSEIIAADKRPVPVSINVSVTDILSFDVPEYLSAAVRKYSIPPVYIEIEISEAAYLKGGPLVMEVEKQLRSAGFKVIMDGFDGNFQTIEKLGAVPDSYKLNLSYTTENLAEIFSNADKLHAVLVADHIESMEQLNQLRKCGCTEGQGYAFYKPMDTAEFRGKLLT